MTRQSASTTPGSELLAPVAIDFGQRALRRTCGREWTIGRHRVERLGDRDDLGLDRDVVVGQAVRIALAVDPFVVRPDDLRKAAQAPEAFKDARPIDGMHLELATLLPVRRPGLRRDLGRDREHPEIVEPSRRGGAEDRLRCEFEFARKTLGQRCRRFEVHGRRRIAVDDDPAQTVDQLVDLAICYVIQARPPGRNR